jgi:hypothetical protein
MTAMRTGVFLTGEGFVKFFMICRFVVILSPHKQLRFLTHCGAIVMPATHNLNTRLEWQLH